jgi:hypothetical protein
MEVGVIMGRVVKPEGLAIGVCTADCTGMGMMVTGAISMGIDSGAGVAWMIKGAMEEEAGTETMIDIEDEYSYTAENAGLGLTCATTDDIDEGTA